MSAAAPRATTASRGATWMLIVLTLISVCNWLDRSIVSILLEPMKKEFHASDTTMGLLTGFSFSLVYGVCSIPLAYLADRTSRRNVLTLALLAWSGMTALSGAAQTVTQLLLARMSMGAAESCGTPTSQAMIADRFPAAKRPLAISIFSSSVYMGTTLGALLGGLLAFHYGWRAALFAISAPGFLLALLLFLTVPEPVRGAADGAKPPPRITLAETARLLGGDPVYRLVLLAMGVQSVVNGATLAWTPAFLGRIHHLDLKELALTLGLVKGVTGIAGVIIGGWIAGRVSGGGVRPQLTLCAGALALCIAPFLGFALAPSVVVSLACAAVFQILLTMPVGVGYAVIHAVAPPSSRALAAAVGSLVTVVVSGLGPLYVGALSDGMTARFGDTAIRYAFTWLVPFVAAASIVYWLASRRPAAAVAPA